MGHHNLFTSSQQMDEMEETALKDNNWSLKVMHDVADQWSKNLIEEVFSQKTSYSYTTTTVKPTMVMTASLHLGIRLATFDLLYLNESKQT